MEDKTELSFEEKVRMVENGALSMEDAARDPNPSMAFTAFAGQDSGPRPGDYDYAIKATTKALGKRKKEESDPSPAKRSKQEKAGTSPLGDEPRLATAARTHSNGVPWFPDEEDFGWEKIAENPGVGVTELVSIMNAEFANRPYTDPITGIVWHRGTRSIPAVGQRYSKMKTTFLERLNAQTNKNAPSMGWAQTVGEAEKMNDD